jgi:hypothetical protein
MINALNNTARGMKGIFSTMNFRVKQAICQQLLATGLAAGMLSLLVAYNLHRATVESLFTQLVTVVKV